MHRVTIKTNWGKFPLGKVPFEQVWGFGVMLNHTEGQLEFQLHFFKWFVWWLATRVLDE